MRALRRKSELTKEFNTFDEYIAEYPPEIQERLEEIRQTIKRIVPEAEERISYNMLSFRFHGNLVYYGAFKYHIGFYPASMTVFERFKYEIKNYKQSGKGTIRFPNKKPLPLDLIKRTIQFRANENLEKN